MDPPPPPKKENDTQGELAVTAPSVTTIVFPNFMLLLYC